MAVTFPRVSRTSARRAVVWSQRVSPTLEAAVKAIVRSLEESHEDVRTFEPGERWPTEWHHPRARPRHHVVRVEVPHAIPLDRVLGPVLPHLLDSAPRGTAKDGEDEFRRGLLAANVVLERIVPRLLEKDFPNDAQAVRMIPAIQPLDVPQTWRDGLPRTQLRRTPRGTRFIPVDTVEVGPQSRVEHRQENRLLRKLGNFQDAILEGLETSYDGQEVPRRRRRADRLTLQVMVTHAAYNTIAAAMLLTGRRSPWGELSVSRPACAAEWLVECVSCAARAMKSTEPFDVLRGTLLQMVCLDDRCRLHPDCRENPELGRACFEAEVRPWIPAVPPITSERRRRVA